ncbi:glutathione-dependent formaldehyde-activating enzyme [Penicillium diatomitis]|uniref:Glutathione-dependent formaldehyde-activating enzyme n=1 Tax=Penicillium diatomitis TaxID=2819901 RepID=A0A9X0BYG7_9EURO|nr:glutathione-dependent formaldehyde-activating enzyme [Penicillium diatomitis]KAJ5489373.1 glutathione-dependent formaldehyde-activating enzyme [Penicillium diatomitis]
MSAKSDRDAHNANSNTPVPYQLCACSICRKIGGYVGCVNIGGIAESLQVVKGQELIKYDLSPHSRYHQNQLRHTHLFVTYGYELLSFAMIRADSFLSRKYHAIKDRGTPDEELCSSERSFCSNCSSMLWLWDHHWPELIHPFASAIDTELPEPAEMVCIMEDSKPKWMRWPEGTKSTHSLYGKDSLEEWHKKHGYFVE